MSIAQNNFFFSVTTSLNNLKQCNQTNVFYVGLENQFFCNMMPNVIWIVQLYHICTQKKKARQLITKSKGQKNVCLRNLPVSPSIPSAFSQFASPFGNVIRITVVSVHSHCILFLCRGIFKNLTSYF